MAIEFPHASFGYPLKSSISYKKSSGTLSTGSDRGPVVTERYTVDNTVLWKMEFKMTDSQWTALQVWVDLQLNNASANFQMELPYYITGRGQNVVLDVNFAGKRPQFKRYMGVFNMIEFSVVAFNLPEEEYDQEWLDNMLPTLENGAFPEPLFDRLEKFANVDLAKLNDEDKP